jgi:hypothetical protein
LKRLDAYISVDDSQANQLWDIIAPNGETIVPKQAIEDVLEMIVQPEDGSPTVQGQQSATRGDIDRLVLEGLNNLAQNIFKDTETKSVTLASALSILDNLGIREGKSSIQERLKRLERKGNISRTDLNDLIEVLEEVMTINLGTCAIQRTERSLKH